MRSVEVLSARAGSSSTFHLALEYAPDAPATLPATLYLKGSFDLGATHGLQPDYEAEVAFYRELAPALGEDVPDCWFAGTDGPQALVLLEDLGASGARFGTAAEPFEVDVVARGLELLARAHGGHWGAPPRLRSRRTEGTDDAAADPVETGGGQDGLFAHAAHPPVPLAPAV